LRGGILENKFNYFIIVWNKKMLQRHIKIYKKIVGQPLLTVSYENLLAKLSAKNIPDGLFLKIVSKGFGAGFANGYL
jgi:hypothetical protein